MEGGQVVHQKFPAAGLADEIQLTVTPFFLGDPKAPRFSIRPYARTVPVGG